VSKGRPEKKREEGRTKAFRKKKRAPPPSLFKKGAKATHDHEIQKRKKKSGCVLPHKRKKATPRLDSVFKNIALLIHSFPERHI
jgi:hypothetical protein